MDENDDEMEQLVWDGDEGLNNLFGVYIKHPNDAFCEYYQTLSVNIFCWRITKQGIDILCFTTS